MNDQTWIDNYRASHRDKLRVVERFHIVNGGKTLSSRCRAGHPMRFFSGHQYFSSNCESAHL
jgi:hypothetical protein